MSDRTVVNDIIKDIRAFCVQYGRDGIAGSIVERSTEKRAFCRAGSKREPSTTAEGPDDCWVRRALLGWRVGPMPGQEFGDAVDRVLGDAAEDVAQVGFLMPSTSFSRVKSGKCWKFWFGVIA